MKSLPKPKAKVDEGDRGKDLVQIVQVLELCQCRAV